MGRGTDTSTAHTEVIYPTFPCSPALVTSTSPTPPGLLCTGRPLFSDAPQKPQSPPDPHDRGVQGGLPCQYLQVEAELVLRAQAPLQMMTLQ